MPHITTPQFTARFPTLVLAGQGFPKKQADREILFVSAVLHLDLDRDYSEGEINDALRKWTARFGDSCGLDHVTLRRYLIDGRYIERDSAGVSYRLVKGDAPITFDAAIKDIDLDQLIIEAKDERERRKQQYLK